MVFAGSQTEKSIPKIKELVKRFVLKRLRRNDTYCMQDLEQGLLIKMWEREQSGEYPETIKIFELVCSGYLKDWYRKNRQWYQNNYLVGLKIDYYE